MQAIADPPVYHRARAAVRFDEISRTLVHALKYADRLDLAPMMGRFTAQAGRELLAEADALVPVPLHWRRLWERRFNQSAMLVAAIWETGVPVAANALKRVKPTAQQFGLSRTGASGQCPGRISGAAGRQGRDDPTAPDPHRRCADHRRDRGRLRPRAVARGGREMWRCWFLPGLPSRCKRPYNTLIKNTSDHDRH
jgi:hypothetical protein